MKKIAFLKNKFVSCESALWQLFLQFPNSNPPGQIILKLFLESEMLPKPMTMNSCSALVMNVLLFLFR